MRAPTLVESSLIAAFAAVLVWLVIPDFVRAREAYIVEMTARATSVCDSELVRIARAARAARRAGLDTSVYDQEPSLEVIDKSLADREAPQLVWPREADLSTIDFTSTNGVSVLVRLRSGERRVDARDLDVDHVN